MLQSKGSKESDTTERLNNRQADTCLYKGAQMFFSFNTNPLSLSPPRSWQPPLKL